MERGAGTGLRGCGAACCKPSVDQRGKKPTRCSSKAKTKPKQQNRASNAGVPVKTNRVFAALKSTAVLGSTL